MSLHAPPLPARLGLFVVAAFFGAATAAAQQAASTHDASVQAPAHHDLLHSLRSQAALTTHASIPAPLAPRPMPTSPSHAGPIGRVLQARAVLGGLPSPLRDIEGIGEGFVGPQGSYDVGYNAPPDSNGAAGDTQYVQIVNGTFAVFDKASGAVTLGPVPTQNLWQGFGDACETDGADPVVLYDQLHHRWVVSEVAFPYPDPSFECVAVSTSDDATGGWYRYAFAFGETLPDYPKLSVWPDAYYATFNLFDGLYAEHYVGPKVCAYDRASMLRGADASEQCFQLSSDYGSLLPADLDGYRRPPAGAPNDMVSFGSDALYLWRFHVDWQNPSQSTLTGPIHLPVASFTPGCDGGACVPQLGSDTPLDTLADRLMFRLAYRNFGDHQSLVVNHTVQADTGRGDVAQTGIRWYEIRDPNGTPTIHQQSTYAPDAEYRWMGSIAMDKRGDMALGYSVSGANMHPAIRYAGRLAHDPLDTLRRERSIIEGTGSQTGRLIRWGDYSAMTVDPVDDCTFWYTTEYLVNDGSFNWHTRIASFKFPSCH